MSNNEINLDEFELLGDDNWEVPHNPEDTSDSRTPINRIHIGAVNALANRSNALNVAGIIARETLPPSYREVFDVSANVYNEATNIYDRTIRLAAPTIKGLRDTAKKSMPLIDKVLPPGMASRIKSFSEAGYNQTYRDYDPDTSNIDNTLKTIFTAETLNARRDADADLIQRNVDRNINKQVFLSNYRLQQTIADGIGRLVGYQDTVLHKYYQKSLELQHRQYFTARDILEHSKASAIDMLYEIKAIVKNTALPNEVKLQKSEAFKAANEQRLIGMVQGSIGQRLRNIPERLRTAGRQQSRNFTDTVNSAFNTGDSMLGGMSAEEAGALGAMHIQEGIGKRLGMYINTKIRDNERVRTIGERLAYHTENMGRRFNTRVAEDETGPFSHIRNLLGSGVVTNELQEGVSHNLLSTAIQPVSWDTISRRTLIEIIPDYMARILEQVSNIATGTANERMVFSSSREQMVPMSVATRDTHTNLRNTIDLNLKEKTDKIIDKIDPDNTLTATERTELALQLTKDSASGKVFNPVRYSDPSNITSSAADKIAALFTTAFEISGGRIANTEASHSNRRVFSNLFNSLEEGVGNFSEGIRSHVATGDKHILRQMGLLRDDIHGGVNHDVRWNMIRDILHGTESPTDEGIPPPPDSDNPPPDISNNPPNDRHRFNVRATVNTSSLERLIQSTSDTANGLLKRIARGIDALNKCCKATQIKCGCAPADIVPIPSVPSGISDTVPILNNVGNIDNTPVPTADVISNMPVPEQARSSRFGHIHLRNMLPTRNPILPVEERVEVPTPIPIPMRETISIPTENTNVRPNGDIAPNTSQADRVQNNQPPQGSRLDRFGLGGKLVKNLIVKPIKVGLAINRGLRRGIFGMAKPIATDLLRAVVPKKVHRYLGIVRPPSSGRRSGNRRIDKIINRIKSPIVLMGRKMLGMGPARPLPAGTTITPDGEVLVDRLDNTAAILANIYTVLRGKVTNTPTGDDPDHRANSWRDILRRRNASTTETNADGTPVASGSRLGKIGGAIAGFAGNAVDKVKNMFKPKEDGEGGGVWDGIKTAGGVAAGWLGKKLLGRAAGTAAVAGAEALAGGAVAGEAVAGGSLLASAGGLLSSAGGLAMAGAPMMMALASNPVGWAILGGAAAIGAGYMAYKYFSRRASLEPLEKLRYLQYGVPINNTKAIASIRYFEDKMQSEITVNDKGVPKVDSDSKELWKQWYSEFGCIHDNVEQHKSWLNWFYHRFLPVYVKHLNAARTYGKVDLLKVDGKIKDDLKVKFVTDVQFGSLEAGVGMSPLSVYSSPWPDIALADNASAITVLTEQIKNEGKRGADIKATNLQKIAATVPALAPSVALEKPKLPPDYDKRVKAEADREAGQVDASKPEGTEVKRDDRSTWDKAKDTAKHLYEDAKEGTKAIYGKAKAGAKRVYEDAKLGVGAIKDWGYEHVVKPIKGSLSSLISGGESGKAGYNAYNRGTVGNKILGPVGPRNLEAMTLSEILADMDRDKMDKLRLFAVGKYQMIPSTLRDGIRTLHIDPASTKYDAKTQESLFAKYLLGKKRPQIAAYITGKSDSLPDAQLAAAHEWASIADPRTGRSAYGNGNKASISTDSISSALKASRESYLAAIAKGLDKDSAYQTAVSSFGTTTPEAIPETATGTTPGIGEATAVIETAPAKTSPFKDKGTEGDKPTEVASNVVDFKPRVTPNPFSSLPTDAGAGPRNVNNPFNSITPTESGTKDTIQLASAALTTPPAPVINVPPVDVSGINKSSIEIGTSAAKQRDLHAELAKQTNDKLDTLIQLMSAANNTVNTQPSNPSPTSPVVAVTVPSAKPKQIASVINVGKQNRG